MIKPDQNQKNLDHKSNPEPIVILLVPLISSLALLIAFLASV